MLNFRIGHTSEQMEADLPRKVEVELAAVALGKMAMLLKGAQIGEQILTTGFLAAKSAESKQLVLHVNTIEFVEGMNHGI